MPAAKKPATPTRSRRSTARTPAVRSTATRRDVERQIARVEKLLDDCGQALQLLGKDMGRGAQDAYKELTRTVTALRRDAQRTNRRMLKDFDKLRAALTPPSATSRSSTTSTARSTPKRAATGSRRATETARPGRSSQATKRTTR